MTVAVDGGYLHLSRAGIEPDLIIGDFDSIGEFPTTDAEIVRLPSEKDDTDTFAAVRIALKRGYKDFCFYCATGGRFSHTLANIQTLLYLAKNDCRAHIFGNGEIYTVVHNGSIELPALKSGYVSVFALSETAEHVTIKNLKYEISAASITNSYPIGISNEFIGKTPLIEVGNGSLLVIYSKI